MPFIIIIIIIIITADINQGCAQGRYLLQLADRHVSAAAADDPVYNYIGYELRSALVDAANVAVQLNPR